MPMGGCSPSPRPQATLRSEDDRLNETQLCDIDDQNIREESTDDDLQYNCSRIGRRF